MFRIVFWDVLACKMIVDRRFRGAYCLHNQGWYIYTSNRKASWNTNQFYNLKKISDNGEKLWKRNTLS